MEIRIIKPKLGCLTTALLAFVMSCNKAGQSGTYDRLSNAYKAYLNSNLQDARRQMEESLQILGGPTDDTLRRDELDNFRYLTLIRLVNLDLLADDKDAASLNVIEAKYWLIQKLRSSGHSSEIIAQAASNVTIDQCHTLVQRLDRKALHGEAPKYITDAVP